MSESEGNNSVAYYVNVFVLSVVFGMVLDILLTVLGGP